MQGSSTAVLDASEGYHTDTFCQHLHMPHEAINSRVFAVAVMFTVQFCALQGTSNPAGGYHAAQLDGVKSST